jgi:diketogulonate reductase-like aldo/keto reductase
MISHLEELLAGSDVVPAVNQVEFSPFLYQKELLVYCKAKGIQLEAYSPLTRGERLNHPNIVATAKKYRRTPAQIMIRWSLQHDVVVIPKSVMPERIEENSRVFDFGISREDMALLDSLSEGLHTSWDPSDLE